jgi:hypothetical protein
MTSPALMAACIAVAAQFAAADEIATAKYRWEHSPHGAMLERILPPAIEPAQLPEPASAGARLVAAYCVQCHYLPNPAMHSAARWPAVVERMVWRMQGKGNVGPLMQDMMGDVKAPSGSDASMLVRYLQKHAQQELDIKKYPDIHTPAGHIYSIACTQCHVLPDPRRHTAREWPAIVERMRHNMTWANRVTGDPVLRTSPELDTGEIVRFLQRNSRIK